MPVPMGKACTKPLRPLTASPLAVVSLPTTSPLAVVSLPPAAAGPSPSRHSLSTWSRASDTAHEGLVTDDTTEPQAPSVRGEQSVPKTSARSLALRLQHLGGSRASRNHLATLLALATSDDDFTRDLRPPHLIRDGYPRLDNGFRFYVCIYGIRVKHQTPALPSGKRRSFQARASLGPSDFHLPHHFVVVSWASGWFVRRTELLLHSGPSTTFNNSFLFHWFCEDLQDLSHTYLTLSIYVVHLNKQLTLLGEVKVDLFTIAIGPIHHDLPLCEVEASSGSGAQDWKSVASLYSRKSSRVQFNVRMSQVCEMLISPVEMIVHVMQNSLGGPDTADVLSFVHQTATINTETSQPVRSKSVNELGRAVKQFESETAGSPQIVQEPAIHSPLDTGEAEIEKAAIGGHSGEDSRFPIRAKWRLDFTPTGVANPTVFPSAWTDLTSTPYWLSLNIPESQAPSVLNAGPPKIGTLQQSFTMLERLDLPHPGLMDGDTDSGDIEVRRTLSHGVSYSRKSFLATSGDPMLDMYKDREVSRNRSLFLRPISTSASSGNLIEPSSERSIARNIAPSATRTAMRLSVVARHGLPTAASALRNSFVSSDVTHETPGLTALLHPDVATDTAEVAQMTYIDVAGRCRQGSIFSNFTDTSIFPSCHLMTTGDTLRQFHLHLRVWIQPLGVGKPRLFGETWIPFFKMYDADIVDLKDKNFYDSHFCETLWNEGRSVAKLEGIIVFQDSPLIRQMMTGVHTERGFDRIAMPVLGELTSLESARRAIPKEILKLCHLQADLAASLFTASAGIKRSIQASDEAPTDIKKTCEAILDILNKVGGQQGTGDYRGGAFIYEDLSALICGQPVLMDLAGHVLDVEDTVPWHVRGLYGQILASVLKRAELDMGSLLPRVPDFCRKYPDLDIKRLVKIARRMEHSISAFEAFVVPSSARGDQNKSPASVKSSIRRLHMFSKLKEATGIASVRRRAGQQLPALNFLSEDRDEFMHTTQTFTSLMSNSTSKSTDTRSEADHLRGSDPVLPLKSPTQVDDRRSTSPSSLHTSHGERGELESSISDAHPCRNPDSGDMTLDATPTAFEVVTPRIKKARLEANLSNQEVADLIMYHKRMKVSRMYLLLLLRVKRYGLNRICSEALFESQRRMLCHYLAVLLIKLPSFRDELLANVLTQEERAAIIPGWRGQEFSLDNESLDLHDHWVSKTFPGLYEIQVAFDWDPFHTALAEYFGPQIVERLETSLKSSDEKDVSDWHIRMLRPRGIVFFTLVEAWARLLWQTIQCQRCYPLLGMDVDKQSYARSSSLLTNVRWDLIPGYATLLKAFLIEIRTRPIAKFPDALLNCSAALLVNDKLLSVFMRMVLTRTSVFSSEQVFAVLNYIDFWLEVLSVKNRPLPLTFDCRFLGRAIETVITSDLALQTAKGLWFVYKRMDLLSSSKMLQILLDLLIFRRFNDLVMHWSWLVRKCFVSLLLYRLSESARRIVARHSDPSKAPPKVGTALAETDRMILWAFALMSRNIALLGLDQVFPSRFLDVNLRQILAQSDTVSHTSSVTFADVLDETRPHFFTSQSLIWNVPHVLPTVQCSPTRNDLLPPFADPSSTDTLCQTRTQVDGDQLVHAFQRPVRVYRQGLKRIRRRRSHREEAITATCATAVLEALTDSITIAKPDDPLHYLPPPTDFNPRHLPYKKCLVKEFAAELEAYKIWVISGTSEVPPMHIPASPLDSNVDVPPEEE